MFQNVNLDLRFWVVCIIASINSRQRYPERQYIDNSWCCKIEFCFCSRYLHWLLLTMKVATAVHFTLKLQDTDPSISKFEMLTHLTMHPVWSCICHSFAQYNIQLSMSSTINVILSSIYSCWSIRILSSVWAIGRHCKWRP